jgi:lipid-A-disaccharide synthase
MFCILPFEVDFFEKKHNYRVHYVGNPTADEVRKFKAEYTETHEEFCNANNLNPYSPIIAILAGSRIQEIHDNLPSMLQAAQFEGYQYVIAAVPAIDDSVYAEITKGYNVHIVRNKTYALLSHSTAALVTSGTATLETAIFNVPQVVCYKTPIPKVFRWAFNHIIKCKYISLVNLIADKEIVQELFADRFTVEDIARELENILPNGNRREIMLDGYENVRQRLGDTSAPENAARQMIELLKK